MTIETPLKISPQDAMTAHEMNKIIDDYIGMIMAINVVITILKFILKELNKNDDSSNHEHVTTGY